MASVFVTDLLLGRRQALQAMAGLAATAAGAGAFAATPVRSSGAPLDFTSPRDNLYAFGKIWAGYDAPVIGAFHGLMYARIPGRRLVPLFHYVGTGVLQAALGADGVLSIKSRETGYFADLRTGDILETWENPFTGKTVEVYHFYNDMLGGRIGAEIPKFLMDGGDAEAATLMNEGTVFPDENGRYPFVLPFEQFGDDLLLSWDYAHRYTNPLTPEGWPTYSTGRTITPSEHFTFAVSRRALEDRSLPTVRMTAGFTRLSEPWPFMRMGGTQYADVTLFGRMHSHKGLAGYGDVPRKLLDYVEKHAPEYLTLPDGWPVTNSRIDTWRTFAQDVPPETEGHPWPGKDLVRTSTQRPPTGLGARFMRGR